MNTSLPWNVDTQDVVLRRETVFDPQMKDNVERVATNIRWTVIDGSPSGFEWGYRGSGPRDLALNILNQFVPPGFDGIEPVDCYRGRCSYTAHKLANRFVEDFLASAPKDGTFIEGATIRDWIKKQMGTDADHRSLAPHFTPFVSPCERTNYFQGEAPAASAGVDSGDLQQVRYEAAKQNLQRALKTTLDECLHDARQQPDTESRQRTFYAGARQIAGLLHAIDVELLRAEARYATPNVDPIIERLPMELRAPTKEMLDTYLEAAALVRKATSGLSTAELATALGIEGDSSALKLQFEGMGPALLIVPQDPASYKAILAAYNKPESVLGFQGSLNLRGVRVLMTLFPKPEDADPSWGFSDARATMIHERAHVFTAMTGVPGAWAALDTSSGTDRFLQTARDYLRSRFRDEVVARAIEGRVLSIQGIFDEGAHYDFPGKLKDDLIAAHKKADPNVSDEDALVHHQALAEDFYEFTSKTADAVATTFSYYRGSIPPLFRVLELLPTDTWASHCKKMHALFPEMGFEELRWA